MSEHENNHENNPQPFGPRPFSLNVQAAQSRAAEAGIDWCHYSAARAAVLTFHRETAAGVEESTAYARALRAAAEFVSDPLPTSAITAQDIALTAAADQDDLLQVAAADQAAARKAGTEMVSAVYAVQEYQRRSAGAAVGAGQADAIAEDAVVDIGEGLWAEHAEALARYRDQVEQLRDQYPTAGPVDGGPLRALGYTEHDRGQTLRAGEVALQARAMEADLNAHYHRHQDAAEMAIWAFDEHLTAGQPSGEAKERALAEAAAHLAGIDYMPEPVNTAHARATAAGDDTAAMAVLEAGETTRAWLAGGELETASDAVDHYHAGKLATDQPSRSASGPGNAPCGCSAPARPGTGPAAGRRPSRTQWPAHRAVRRARVGQHPIQRLTLAAPATQPRPRTVRRHLHPAKANGTVIGRRQPRPRSAGCCVSERSRRCSSVATVWMARR